MHIVIVTVAFISFVDVPNIVIQKRIKQETNCEYYCCMLFLECSDNLLEISVAIALLKGSYLCMSRWWMG